MCKNLLLGLGILFAFNAYTQDLEISDERRIKIEKEISLAVESAVEENVTPLILAEKYNMPFPPKLPIKTIPEVKKEVDVEVEGMVEEKFPASQINKHAAEAIKKYALYKKGEKVTVRIRPTGRMAVVTGIYKGFNRKGELLIGSYNVPKVDMTESVMVHFDEELSQKKIAKYMDNKLFYFNEDRKAYRQKIVSLVLAKKFKEAGYYRFGNKYLPADEFLKKSLQEARQSYRNKMAEILTEVTFKKHGYVKKSGKWTEKPVEVISLVREEKEEKAPKAKTLDEKINASDLPVRKREKLFEPSFYDTDF
ncbi:MAG: hypothetical protein MK132_08965 [Lentisphaerales bacterium]|nr:hypothetical protein [Lentisphaerales bacterium]